MLISLGKYVSSTELKAQVSFSNKISSKSRVVFVIFVMYIRVYVDFLHLHFIELLNEVPLHFAQSILSRENF